MTTVHVPGASGQRPAYGPGLRTPAGEQRLSDLAGTRKRLNGCAAAAYAALYANVDVITAYAIRPYTAIMMNLAQFIADGILDAEYIHADGEHAQLSAAFGAGSARASLSRCASCHRGDIGPSLPFADPQELAHRLPEVRYPRGSLLQEILFRLSPSAGIEHMPMGRDLQVGERDALVAYFRGLAGAAGP